VLVQLLLVPGACLVVFEAGLRPASFLINMVSLSVYLSRYSCGDIFACLANGFGVYAPGLGFSGVRFRA